MGVGIGLGSTVLRSSGEALGNAGPAAIVGSAAPAAPSQQGPTPCGSGAPLSDSFTGSTLDSTKWGPYTDRKGSTVAQTSDHSATVHIDSFNVIP